MRRLSSSFLTLWIAVFVPSLCVWGFMVRWSSSTADQFETIWRWTADRLAFPLLLHRPTTWSWAALSSDSRLDASLGFLYLTGLWSLMLTLPLVVVGGWWMWLASRGARRATGTALGTTDPQATLSLPETAPTLHSPLGALYLVTIPLALLYHAARVALTVIRPAMTTFAICWLVAMAIFSLWLSQVAPRETADALVALRQTGWEGYLDAWHVPRLANDHWYAWWIELWYFQPPLEPLNWDQPMTLRYLIALHAARHALAPTMVVATWSFVAALVRRTKEDT